MTSSLGTGFTVLSPSVTIPNYDVYIVWINGLSVDQAVHQLQHSQNVPNASFPLLKNYVMAQYRQFEMMEHFLHRPVFFGDQALFCFPNVIKLRLIELFDEIVLRELIGKKLNYRSRKDLDDVVSKTKVPLGSCRRQFDNLKRIAKRVEDARGDLIACIEQQFLLPRHLASQYAHVMFINVNRLDTSKKKLSQFNFSDFEYCASVLMKYFTAPSQQAIEEFDTNLAQDIREVKTNVLNNKEVMEEFKQLVTEYLQEQFPSSASTVTTPSSGLTAFSFTLFGQQNTVGTSRDFAVIFKQLVRNILTIGQGLNQPKEARDIFVDILEKVVEPCVAVGWRANDVEAFCQALRACWLKLTTLNTYFVRKHASSWIRLTTGIQLAGLRMFNDLSVALASTVK